MTISQQIATYLDAQTIGTYDESGITGDIYIDQMPESNQLICIYNKPGFQSDSKLGYRSKGIQIIYRGDLNPITSEVKANDIFEALHGFEGYLVTNENYIVSILSVNGGPTRINVDENGNFEYSINFIVEFQQEEE